MPTSSPDPTITSAFADSAAILLPSMRFSSCSASPSTVVGDSGASDGASMASMRSTSPAIALANRFGDGLPGLALPPLPRPQQRLFTLAWVGDDVDERQHRDFEDAPGEFLTDSLVCPVEVRHPPLLRLVPALGPSRQLNTVLYGKRNHCLPQLVVAAAVVFNIQNVAAATTSKAPPAVARIDVEAGRLVLMVRQRTATREPCSTAERLQVRVAPCHLLNRHGITYGLTAPAETVDVIWCPV